MTTQDVSRCSSVLARRARWSSVRCPRAREQDQGGIGGESLFYEVTCDDVPVRPMPARQCTYTAALAQAPHRSRLDLGPVLSGARKP